MTVPNTAPESVGMSSERLARIRPAMQTWIERGTLAGAGMMLARRGEIVYSEQIGQLARGSGDAMPQDAIGLGG